MSIEKNINDDTKLRSLKETQSQLAWMQGELTDLFLGMSAGHFEAGDMAIQDRFYKVFKQLRWEHNLSKNRIETYKK